MYTHFKYTLCAFLCVVLCTILWTGCARSELSAQDCLRAADAAYRSGNYARAATLYYSVRKEYPELPAIRISLGYTYMNLGWLRYAGGEFSKAVELSSSTNALAWIGLGTYYAMTNEWKRAGQCYAQARTYAPESPVVYRNLGNAFFHTKEYKQAAYNFKHAARLAKPDDKLYETIGICREKSAQWQAAVEAYQKAYEINPGNVHVVHRLALLYRDRFNNIPKARTFFTVLESLDTDLAEQERAAFQKAFTDSVIPNPNVEKTATTTTVVSVAGTNSEVSTTGKTLEETRKKIQEERQHSRADFYEALAKKSLANDLPKEAVRYYVKALQEAPDRGYYNREIARLYEKNFEDLILSLKYYDAYLKYAQTKESEDFEDTVAHVKELREQYNRKEAELRRQRRLEEEKEEREVEERRFAAEQARKEAYEVARQEPQTYDDVINSGVEYMRSGDIEEARRYFQKALTINDAYPNAYYNLGLVYLKKTNYTAGIEYFNKALEKNPQYAESHLALGTVYDRLDRIPEATEHFIHYLELAPNTGFANSVRDWLTQNAGAR